MKILYVGPFKDFSGYSTAARGYLNALNSVGTNLAARAVKYDYSENPYVPTAVEKELLTKPLDDIDIVLQHTTPNELRFNTTKPIISITTFEGTHIPNYWVENLNKTKAVITFCDFTVRVFKDCGVKVPVYKVPHTFDLSKYKNYNLQPLIANQDPNLLKDRHVFYNISQLSTKKGIDLLLRAYFRAFAKPDLKDRVVLVLKTYINMGYSDPAQERDQIIGFINNIKAGMRIPADQLPKVVLLCGKMPANDINRLHISCDTYINSSICEGFNIPAFEAACYGNNLITTVWDAASEYAHLTDNSFIVKHIPSPMFGISHPDPELYTSKNLVGTPDLLSLEDEMFNAFNKGKVIDRKVPEGFGKFDYSVIGPQMLDIIKEVYSG